MTKSNNAIRSIEGTKQFRSFHVERKNIDEETRSVWLAFSSEAEYERSFGIEILDHSPESVDLARLKDGAPFLVNHNTDELAGVTEEVEISKDRRGRARVRLGSSARAEEIWQDIVQGIRKHISVGYFVDKMILDREVEGGPDVYRVTRWTPFEISTVPVPADPTVGIGRSADDEINETQADEPEIESEEIKMDENKTPEIDVKAVEAAATERARKAEQDRMRGIDKLAGKHGMTDLGDEFKNNGRSLDEFRAAVLEKMGAVTKVQDSPEIGLTKKESDNFSFLRAIRAKADPGNIRVQEEAAFELECSRAVEDQLHRKAQGFFVPEDVLSKRDFIAGPGGTGQYLVGTDSGGQSFIDVLRNQMILMQLGATELRGLVGDVAIPSMTASHTAYWIAESGSPTESKPTMGQHTMSPKTIGAFNDISRKLLIQSSPSAELLVRNDIAKVLAIGIDLAGIHGTGIGNQPTGIAATSGIGSVAGGTNGLAPTWAHIVNLQREVAKDNGDVGRAAYLTSPYLRGKLLTIYPNTTGGDTPLWANDPGRPGWGILNGTPAAVSNQVSDTLTKGNSSVCSAIFYSGNWADLLIGYWSGLDIVVDPFTGSSSGTVRVVGLQDVDVDVRHPQSFAAMLDALGA